MMRYSEVGMVCFGLCSVNIQSVNQPATIFWKSHPWPEIYRPPTWPSAGIPQRWQACSSPLQIQGSPQSWQTGRWCSPASLFRARSPSLCVQSCRGDTEGPRTDVTHCSNLRNASVNSKYDIGDQNWKGWAVKSFTRAADERLFVATAKTERTERCSSSKLVIFMKRITQL